MPERYYPDPETETLHLRNTVIALILFFGVLVLIVALIFINAQTIAKTLPFSAEQSFAQPYENLVNYFNKDKEPPPQHAEIRAYVSDLAQSLSDEMGLPEDYTLSVHYVDSEMINAFAMLGGHVFVTRGLLDALDTENSLSLVLAHEIAHVKHRDPLAGMGRGLALQLVFSFVTGQSGRGTTLAATGGELGLLHFSREQEADADVAGMRALHRLYGHVEGAGGLFELLIEDSASVKKSSENNMRKHSAEQALQGWLSTHPELAERLEAMSALAKAENWPTQGEQTPLPVWLKEAVEPAFLPDT
jgi:predicted Zn-dependent protease